MTRDVEFGAERSGVYLVPEDAASLRVRAGAARLKWIDLNLARVATKQEFLAACRKSLRLPRYFGGNWDALADCLKDRCADTVITARNCAAFAAAAPEDYATAIEVLQDTAAYWKERESAFVVLVDAAVEGVDLPRFAPAGGA
ncbi:MAG: barstar family protein [Burkholderiales bacterium]|nr:barstar family protein [Burkholderiales bacterium]